jgi:transcriptional regulator with XRE-family HTH domain
MGFTQKQVACLLGYSDTSMISHYEHGRSFPPLPIALGMEIILRVPVAFLFPGFYEELRNKIRKMEIDCLGGPGQQHLF